MGDSVPGTPEWSQSLSRELEDVIAKQNMLTSRTRRRMLSSLQETSSQAEDGEMEKLRMRAIEEIINSEKTYLRQLEMIEEYFMNPIQDSGLLPRQTFVSIFGDILGIRQVNKELLNEMEVSTEKIGKVFLELAPYLKFYSTYANDFQEATKLVEQWTEKSKPFKELLSNQESRPEVKMKLNSLLITPVQRIPRYKLLLEDIIKNTPRFHPDKTNLEQARTQIDAVAWHINDQIKEHESNMIMVDIQTSLQGGLPKILKPGRKLLRQGTLMKVNKNGGHAQARYVILFSDMLMYCKYKGSSMGAAPELPKPGVLEVCCLLPLKHLTVEQVMGKGVFTVKCQKEQLVLYSANAEDGSWVESIRKTVKQHKKNSASLKRESSKFEPIRKTDMLKMRRESLSSIMLMRKTEETKREVLEKEEDGKSSLSSLFDNSPRKRRQGQIKSETPKKMKQIVEEAISPKSISESPKFATIGAVKGTTPTTRKTSKMVMPIQVPVLGENKQQPKETHVQVEIGELPKPDIITVQKHQESPKSTVPKRQTMRQKSSRTIFKKHPRNSVKSLSLSRALKLKKEDSTKTVFRSPSLYDEPHVPRIKAEDAMKSFLSGKIVPLTPSLKPTNVDHLVNRSPDPEEQSSGEKENISGALVPVSNFEEGNFLGKNCTIS